MHFKTKMCTLKNLAAIKCVIHFVIGFNMVISNSEKDANGVQDASQVYYNSTAYEPNYTEIDDIPVKRQEDIEMQVKPSEAEYTNVHGYNKPVYNEPVDFEIKSRKGKCSCERTGLVLLTLLAVGIGVALAMSIFGCKTHF